MHPGDLVIGDKNGVVIVPREYCATLLGLLREREAAEREYVAAVAAGQFSNAWVDAVLEDHGVEIDEGGSAAHR